MNNIHMLTASSMFLMLMAGPVHAMSISKTDYDMEKTRISKTYDADKAQCKELSGNKKDVCIEEAKAKESIAKAELEAQYKDTGKARIDAAQEKVNANYNVAKERCDDLAGDAKSLCVIKAKAERDRGLADVKANKKTYEARKDISEAKEKATEERREANYDVDIKKCDQLAGDAKDACQDNVKKRYGEK